MECFLDYDQMIQKPYFKVLRLTIIISLNERSYISVMDGWPYPNCSKDLCVKLFLVLLLSEIKNKRDGLK